VFESVVVKSKNVSTTLHSVLNNEINVKILTYLYCSVSREA